MPPARRRARLRGGLDQVARSDLIDQADALTAAAVTSLAIGVGTPATELILPLVD